jgi:NAD(P)-dependent dehydrogenase (short-subunit alcohol dehydrogenase family)
MSFPFNNQVTLITGAGSGLGRQLALEMSRRGAVIAAVDLRAEPLQGLITELKQRSGAGAWEVADVTQREALTAAVAKLTQRLGPIEILIANAGIGIETAALNFRAIDLEKQVAVNLTGVANSVEAVLPGMLARGRGHLVAISSLASYRGFPRMAGYCASKAGVRAMMDSLRLELRPRGIKTTTICPGWIRTPLTENLPGPKPALLAVEDAASRIVAAIRRGKSFHAFPRGMWGLLAFNRLLPTNFGDWMVLQAWNRLMGKQP